MARRVFWSSQPSTSTRNVYATWGLFLMVVGVAVIIQASKVQRRSITVTAVLGFLFVVGAGFNGASFLNYRDDLSSMIMASRGT